MLLKDASHLAKINKLARIKITQFSRAAFSKIPLSDVVVPGALL